jgi:hypothetical protein
LKENWGIKFAHISKADCGKHWRKTTLYL